MDPGRSVDLRRMLEPMFAKSSTGAKSSEQLRPDTGRLEPKCEKPRGSRLEPGRKTSEANGTRST